MPCAVRNDAARLADDAIHKLLIDRDPIAGPALASQPTLSRFENAVGWRDLLTMGHGLADTVIAHHRRRLKRRARRITIDLDPTDDPTHGQQEFTFFNGHYDTWCYLPGSAPRRGPGQAIIGRPVRELQVGDHAELSREVRRADIADFVGSVGDLNPGRLVRHRRLARRGAPITRHGTSAGATEHRGKPASRATGAHRS